MECLPGARLETILHKLTIFGKGGTLQYAVAAISLVIKERMTLTEHVHAYLMCASRLKHTFHNGDIAETFQHLVMGHGMFPYGRVVKHCHLELIARIAGYIADDSTLRLIKIAPHHRYVFTTRGLMEKLIAEMSLSFGSLSHHEQSRRVLVNPMDESRRGSLTS